MSLKYLPTRLGIRLQGKRHGKTLAVFLTIATLIVPIIVGPSVVNGKTASDEDDHASAQTAAFQIWLPLVATQEGSALSTLPDDYDINEDTELNVGASEGVLANDSSSGSGPLTAELVIDVEHGELSLNSDGSFDYRPRQNFFGQDRFVYRARGIPLATGTASVTVAVQAVADPPTVGDVGYQTNEDILLDVDAVSGLLANASDPDQDALDVLLISDVSFGELTLQENGAFLYRPDPDMSGPDSFTYKVSDGVYTSNVATATLTVLPVNDAPVALGETYQTQENTRLDIDVANGVLVNDEDPDSSSLTAQLDTDVAHGVLALASDGSFSYDPDAGFDGQDMFSYRVSDGESESGAVEAMITVMGGNVAPRFVSGRVAFSTEVIGTGVDEAHAIVAADFDGDGDIDAAATDYIDGLVLRYTNDGSENFTESVLDPELEGAYPAHVSDIDQDGDVDVFAGGYLADTYVWYRNNGSGVFTNVYIDIAADGAHSMATDDMDGDGDIDLVTADQDAGAIGWYKNDGANNFTRYSIDDEFTDAKRAEIADVNGDGELDIVAASFRLDEIAWYENDGSENFSKHVIYDDADGAYYVAPADADGDGDMDLFSASQNDNTIAWYENDGDENFTTRIIDTTMEGARSVIATDLDGDGDVDAVAAAVIADEVIWYENNGSGNFTRRVIDNTANGPYGVFAVDMDGDGDMDVLSANKWSRDIRFHAQYRFHTASMRRGATLLLNSSRLQAEDNDDEPADLIYTLTAVPDHGQIRRDGAPIALNGTFTQADINVSRITYTHNGGNTGSDQFSFSVHDNGEFAPLDGTFQINLTD